jgi:hypothetical protein
VASLTVRNIPDDAKLRFRQIAAAHGRSMEEHLRQLVIDAESDGPATSMGVQDMNQSFRHFEPLVADPKSANRARIERLIALGRGLDFEAPPREVGSIKETGFS